MSFGVTRPQCHEVLQKWANIGSGNGLLPDDTKPLPEPMLTYHQPLTHRAE